MADTTEALPSVNEPVVDRYRRWSPRWYPFIKQLLTNIRSQAQSLFTIEETIDEINGKWSIQINENNRVRGLVTLDATGVLTEFSVLADKFIIVHPAANGTTIQAFIVGNIGGAPGVGVNGNLVVDGTILARHIAVDSLSALTADLGTVTAGLIQSADGKSRWNLDTGEFVIGAP